MHFSKDENIVGKGENAGHQHFLLFQKCFQKLSSSGSYKRLFVMELWKEVFENIVRKEENDCK